MRLLGKSDPETRLWAMGGTGHIMKFDLSSKLIRNARNLSQPELWPKKAGVTIKHGSNRIIYLSWLGEGLIIPMAISPGRCF